MISILPPFRVSADGADAAAYTGGCTRPVNNLAGPYHGTAPCFRSEFIIGIFRSAHQSNPPRYGGLFMYRRNR